MAMAKLMPEETILENIETSIKKYKFLKKDSATQMELMMYTQMWMMKIHIDKDGMAKAMNEITDMFNIQEKFSNHKHN